LIPYFEKKLRKALFLKSLRFKFWIEFQNCFYSKVSKSESLRESPEIFGKYFLSNWPKSTQNSIQSLLEIFLWSQWSKLNSNPLGYILILKFKSLPWILKCPWFGVIGLNFEPFDQIPNFLFRKGFKAFINWKFIEVQIPWVKFHFWAKSNPDIQMDVKILFLQIQILSLASISFRRISIFLDLRLRIEFWNIPNLEFKFIWYKSLNHFPNFYLWERSNTFIQIQISIWIHSNQPPKIRNSNSYSFLTFSPVRNVAHSSFSSISPP
jgi:hypothetical protein